MPLHIIRQDITKIECDAIVNAANNSLLGGGGVDGAIHMAAGSELLEECKTLGGCKTGEAKITKGYKLPCKYVIHTVGPIWEGGANGEKELLTSCYKNSLDLAKQNGCETVAFPLISSGAYGYPRDRALRVAVNAIKEFLFDNEMTVYLVVFDKASYQISSIIFNKVQRYIDDNYVDRRVSMQKTRGWPDVCMSMSIHPKYLELDERCEKSIELTLESMIERMDDNFAVTLLKLIDVKNMTDVECYKKANVSKQTWWKIMNEKDYKPSKNTVIAFAIALGLTFAETQSLLATVGFTLSHSNKFDIIIEYFLKNRVYDIFIINETLFKFDQVCLGV
ncbi:MAG: O-acetyl-ADP-ribose deacetylase [Clostridia bacterium]|nr:O-acetyl-ADP-ribose deacetylase [Clostridia bacterium]MBR2385655.1 O-acetyl-ADP-ribose deacetylase [Clostridia bacterium]